MARLRLTAAGRFQLLACLAVAVALVLVAYHGPLMSYAAAYAFGGAAGSRHEITRQTVVVVGEDTEDAEAEALLTDDETSAAVHEARRPWAGVCGGAPAELLPFSVEDSPFARRFGVPHGVESGAGDAAAAAAEGPGSPASPGARSLLHQTVGYSQVRAGCARETLYKIPNENDGPGPTVKKAVKPAERGLAACLTDFSRCDGSVRAPARALASIKALGKGLRHPALQRRAPNGKRFKTCALVGNAGHLARKEYGQYIDRHELVVRFNVLPTEGFAANVGNRTGLRVVNHRRSVAACCRGNFPEARAGETSTGVLLWFPAAQGEILGACKRRFPANPRYSLNPRQSKELAKGMVGLRSDMQRLGLGPFGRWIQLTSGAHAVMLFLNLCDSVSLYGFTTYMSNRGQDQYAGRAERAGSGARSHDWNGEKMAWRLLHAAGLATICSM